LPSVRGGQPGAGPVLSRLRDALAEAAADGREVRKTVTVVFSDLVESTPLGERLDPESLRAVIARYYDRTAQVLARHGGTVAKFIGDAVLAVFGIPRLHEDDALRAVRAAGELGGALEELNAELEAAWGVRLALRTGVNTGEVVAGDAVHGQDLVVGDVVNVAARLEQAAGPGEVLLGERTWQLVRDAVTVEPMAPLALKGKAEPVACFRLLGVRPDLPGHARHLDAPMVGRRRELGLLGGALDHAVGGRRCQLAVVLGPAGVGKSRLLQEFLETVQGQSTVLRGRCLEYGEGLTWWPIAEAIRAAVSVSGPEGPGEGQAGLRSLLAGEEHAAFVAEGLAGLAEAAGRTASREEIPWAVTRLFEVLARRRPWWSRSTTSTGPSRRCSTCSSTWPAPPVTRPSCWSGWPGRSCWTSARAGGPAAPTPPRSRSSPSARRSARGWSTTCSAAPARRPRCCGASPSGPVATRCSSRSSSPS
jgi:class 3 adenylate cyclase